MSSIRSRHSPAELVTTLREAGCVFAEDEAQLLVDAAASADALRAMVRQRVGGLPLEHILGWTWFCGQRITVDPGVFVPRRRTELLVRQATALAPPGPVIVEVCCGTGAVGAVLAATLDRPELHAADLDPAAVRCAQRNIPPAVGHAYVGDLLDAVPLMVRGRVDLLVVNAPYVPTNEIALMPREAREHEPRLALDGGVDGLDVHRRIATAAPSWLAAGGHLLIETSERQATRVADTFVHNGLHARVSHDEELDSTVVIGTRLSVDSGFHG